MVRLVITPNQPAIGFGYLVNAVKSNFVSSGKLPGTRKNLIQMKPGSLIVMIALLISAIVVTAFG